MKNILFEETEYKEFETEEEVDKWAEKYYFDLINSKDLKTVKSIIEYTGNMAQKYNKAMRNSPSIESKEFEEKAKGYLGQNNENISQIFLLYKLTNNYEIPENIILHRYTSKKDLKKLLKNKPIKKKTMYQDKAFTSSGLLKQNLSRIKEQRHYNVLLKIYTPKNTKGIYADIDKSFSLQRLKEKEIILKPLTKFRIIKVHRFTRPLLIEVKAELE